MAIGECATLASAVYACSCGTGMWMLRGPISTPSHVHRSPADRAVWLPSRRQLPPRQQVSTTQSQSWSALCLATPVLHIRGFSYHSEERNKRKSIYQSLQAKVVSVFTSESRIYQSLQAKVVSIRLYKRKLYLSVLTSESCIYQSLQAKVVSISPYKRKLYLSDFTSESCISSYKRKLYLSDITSESRIYQTLQAKVVSVLTSESRIYQTLQAKVVSVLTSENCISLYKRKLYLSVLTSENRIYQSRCLPPLIWGWKYIYFPIRCVFYYLESRTIDKSRYPVILISVPVSRTTQLSPHYKR
jgi:hypothetical protein